MLEILCERFAAHMERHEGVAWSDVEARLLAKPEALAVLERMEQSGGEPDTIGYAGPAGELVFCDCVKESPAERRSLCYDGEALRKRKKNPPKASAAEQAASIGVALMPEELYRTLQRLGEFDTRSSSWIATPARIRERGGALFCERRYGEVFTFHNGAESYYSSRGWRGYLYL